MTSTANKVLAYWNKLPSASLALCIGQVAGHVDGRLIAGEYRFNDGSKLNVANRSVA